MISLSMKAHNKMHNRDGETLTSTGIELLRKTARKYHIQDVDQLIKRMEPEATSRKRY